MKIRLAKKEEYLSLAEMKWAHCKEDDIVYGEHNLKGVSKKEFLQQFVCFLNKNKNYKNFVAEENGEIVSAISLCLIKKLPKPNGNSVFIGYVTNVFTKKEFRNLGIGGKLLNRIKIYAKNKKCELLFVWPSEKSFSFYEKNGFKLKNEICQCVLMNE